MTGPGGRPDPAPDWVAWVDQSCRVVEAAGQWRSPTTFDALGPAGVLTGTTTAPAQPVISFASNDYLGLASHPEVMRAAAAAVERWGTGSGASRLVTGSRPVHDELEAALATWRGCDRAVLFPTGFAANLSVLSVFGSEGAHVLSDELNHASIIDGCRMARAPVTVYPHRDLPALDRALAQVSGRSLIVTDTVFSMDGDIVDLAGLFDVAARHRSLLVLDEAHAVLGPALPPPDLRHRVDVLRVGTLSKALGSLGGFVAGPARFVDLLVNRARPYIFTTATSPADAGAALAALRIVASPEGDALRARLSGHVSRVAARVGLPGQGSPILPVVIGDEADAVAASRQLLSAGLWVPAIRPPTVPPGTSRLRVTLSAAHTDDQVDRLLDGLASVGLLREPAGAASGGPEGGAGAA